MKRIGWKWLSPNSFQDQNDIIFDFSTSSRKAIAGMARMAYMQVLDSRIARKFGLHMPVNMDPARAVLNDDTLTPLEAGCLTAFLAKAVWTQQRLHQQGLA